MLGTQKKIRPNLIRELQQLGNVKKTDRELGNYVIYVINRKYLSALSKAKSDLLEQVSWSPRWDNTDTDLQRQAILDKKSDGQKGYKFKNM